MCRRWHTTEARELGARRARFLEGLLDGERQIHHALRLGRCIRRDRYRGVGLRRRCGSRRRGHAAISLGVVLANQHFF
jgi:hypothetical protein